jgi:adenosylhomocysteine nucleosidase
MKKIVIIAALPGELKPLVKGWDSRGHNLWLGRIGDNVALAVAGGIGAAAAERAMDKVFTSQMPDAVVSYGWAGALTCAVKPPAACVIKEVVEAGSGESFRAQSADGYRLITLDHVARPDEKRGLAEKYQSVLVDMEAAVVARRAAKRGLPFYCFKGISDGYNDVLPDFNNFLNSEGQMRTGALIAHSTVRPKYWAPLWRLGGNSKASAVELADLAQESLRKSL